jgi:type II secretory ATPase GspE/PulE/Tfp pilus assembly ATPase PilB-like protein
LPEIPADDLKTAEWRVLGLVKELQLLIDRFWCRNPDDLPLMEQIVATLLQYGLESGARTILLEPGRTEMSVRLRQSEPPEGKVRIPQSLYPALFQVLKEAAGLDPAERRRPQEGPLLATHGDRRLELRLVCLPGEGGEVAHVHLPATLPRFNPIGLGKLGLFPDQMAAVDEILARESGLVLVAGMAGDHRTRALYALLNRTAPPHGHALCIEDPVRFLVPSTTQLSIDSAGGLSHAELLRTCLREEPDALLLDDLPDPETARLALSAARSGRKVLAGFPSDRAASVPADLISMGIPAYQVAAGLAGVLVQRRARRLCEQCKKPDPNAGLYQDRLCSLYSIWDHFPQAERAMTAAGCEACRRKGYSGYVPLFECLPVTPAVRAAITQNAAPDELQALAAREGRVALATDGYRRVKMGEVSLEELLRVLQG